MVRALPATRYLVLAAALTTVLCALLYGIPQHWPFVAPTELPLTLIDRVVPFWPLSGVLYFGAFVFLLASFAALRGARSWRFLLASLIAQVISTACFLLWPIAYPRELYPLPADASALGTALVDMVRLQDAAVNCLPSMHVCTVTLCVLALRGSRGFLPALFVALPIAASTLTFKQHYFVDAVTGAMLGFASWWMTARWERATLRSSR